ncbi:SDR family oxidoreductase [Methylopila turkensis]|uniref:NAD(P)-binding domain-containing protein n=1 Tax=Methylopila turkensis TaxID=1437816 RepID=A0A9W6JPY6_9HYPH|nr:SDR family oxidoreductase [Methylopila turkensis]GLK80144.1 hypothetical protein GCM10008174_18850 [Methylopila turkensis]
MNVLVLGAYGFIGSSVVDALVARGWDVIGVGRSIDAARRRRPDVRWRAADIARLAAPDDWALLLQGVDAVVNCAGALQDGGRDDVSAVQARAMFALYGAAARAGVAHIVQISATRAAEDADTVFMRSKGEADAALKASGLIWTILRPGLVVGPGAYGGTALLRGLAAFPIVSPTLAGAGPIQTAGVDEVAEAVVAALDGRVPPNVVYDLVEDAPHSLEEIVAAFRVWLGHPAGVRIALPRGLARVLCRAGDLFGWLGWRPPLRTTALNEIEAGVRGDAARWRAARGAGLRPLGDTLARMPSSIQERWFARLFLLKPFAISVLAAFWIASGAIALFRFDAAVGVLADRAGSPGLSALAVGGGAVLDLALGFGLLLRRTHVAAALGMVATTCIYLLLGSVLAPDLWLDPLGPLVKTWPGLALALVVAAIAEDR